jgi:hypothetical protein
MRKNRISLKAGGRKKRRPAAGLTSVGPVQGVATGKDLAQEYFLVLLHEMVAQA